MITVAFILAQLFLPADNSWWWILLFILFDGIMWETLKGAIRG